MSKSVDDLVASIPASRSAGDCWAEPLTGRVAAFLAALREREASGVTLHRNTILDTLNDEFDVKIGHTALTRHLKGRCRCV